MSKRTILTLTNSNVTLRVVRDSENQVFIVEPTDKFGRRPMADAEFDTRKEAVEHARWLIERPEQFEGRSIYL